MHLRVCCVAWSEGTLPGALILFMLAVTSLAASAVARPSDFEVEFDIPAGALAAALDRFSEQSGLQIVYDHDMARASDAPRVAGPMSPARALDRLLKKSGAVWSYLDHGTVAIRAPDEHLPPPEAPEPGPARDERENAGGVVHLEDVRVIADPRRVLPNEASSAAFGFGKPLLETPRAVSFISEETIDLFALSAVEDLVRVVPGTFTTTRFGIQGAVDVRNVPADTFFRGMRRLSLQGHGRSVLAAMDTIEIVAGPPAPIHGMGKLGGYTNMVPKSGRATSGSYLTETQGFAQLIGGEYTRREASFGVGGPLAFGRRAGRRGGYYVYGLFEDSDSFSDGVPIKQQVLQVATSLDDFAGPFRLEAGANYQESRTAGALTARLTQDLVDGDRYIRGTPLVDLDANGDGRIGYLEMQRGSPVAGTLAPMNQPLMQTWAWPTDSNGRALPIDRFAQVAGIPQAMYDYLVAHPEADPTGLLRAQGPGGPQPVSGRVPVGMVLDPRDVGYDQLDLHRAAAFEKDSHAEFLTLFVDLIRDADADFTVRNQLFFDRMDQFKSSNQPFGQQQQVYVIEDKLTVTRRLEGLPDGLRIDSLASLNLRNTVSEGRSASGDFGTHRTDAMAPTWSPELGGMTPETLFASPFDDATYENGYPWGTSYRSSFSEIGLGVLFDIDVGSRTNLLLGGRFDGSRARSVEFAGSFSPASGTSADPGTYLAEDERADAWDGGASWSASLSYALRPNVRPYLTWARSSIVLDGNNNALSDTIIEAGHIGAAQLQELGFKASALGDRLFVAAAAYEQQRIEVESDDPTAVLFAYATATNTRGWTAELKWVPVRNLFLSCYALNQTTRFEPNAGSVQLVDARTLGFRDVTDPVTGAVIYPAEAFLYGGRSRIALPAGLSQYAKKQGNPDTQFGLSTSYQWNNGLGVTLSGNYFSETCTGRLCTVRLPETYVVNAGVLYELGRLSFKLDVSNLLDERYFRARTGDTLGNVLAQAMSDRRWQLTARAEF